MWTQRLLRKLWPGAKRPLSRRLSRLFRELKKREHASNPSCRALSRPKQGPYASRSKNRRSLELDLEPHKCYFSARRYACTHELRFDPEPSLGSLISSILV